MERTREFEKLFTFISTGGKKGFYTLGVWGVHITSAGVQQTSSVFVQNLSTDKTKAITKAEKLSANLGLPLKDEIDFDLKEIERNAPEEGADKDEDEAVSDPMDDKWTELDNTPLDQLDGQDLAIALIRKGKNVFVTGPGGCGKSWVIREVHESKSTVLCAPTGIAAINIGGVTCHSLFGLPTGLPTEMDKRQVPSKMKEVFKSDTVKRIIIDEVGMLRADFLDLIDARLKLVKKNSLPFGGVQVVVVGDFYQLEPIVSNPERQAFYSQYKSPFCFNSEAWGFQPVLLEKVFRQEKLDEVAVLNSIRQKDKYYKRALEWIKEKSNTQIPTELTTYLCARKAEAENINSVWYGKLKAKEKLFYGQAKGNYKWDYSVPAPQKLSLKQGCKVLLCANDPNGQFKNGQTGTVLKLGSKDVIVQLDSTKEHVIVAPFTWEQHRYVTTGGELERVADKAFTQLPIKLGWAITIHASQGMTLEDVCVDVGDGCFSHGQLYVALSRIRNLSNINIGTPLRESDVIVKKEVVEYYESIRE